MGDAHSQGEAHLVPRQHHCSFLVSADDRHLAANGKAEIAQLAVEAATAANGNDTDPFAFRCEQEWEGAHASIDGTHN